MDSIEIERIMLEEVTRAGRERAADALVAGEQWSRANLIETLEATGSEEFEIAIAELKSGNGTLTVSDMYDLWGHATRAADHVTEDDAEPLLRLRGQIAETVVKAWQEHSK